VTPEDARAFLRERHHAVMATTRADGHPQLSPVLAVVDESGRVVVSTRNRSVKVRNLRRDPHVALCLISDDFFGGWAQVEGTVEIVELPEAMEILVDYYRRATGEHEDWDEYRAAMRAEGRVVVRFDIERAGPSTPS
jgi:PPOX class probable F420-dependent enzyme